MRIKKLSVIIPSYNEAATITQVISRVKRADIGPIKKEIIIVDDGSTDQTAKVLAKLKVTAKGRSSSGRKSGKLIVLTHKVNLGKGAAVRSALKKAGGDVVVIQDADLEYNPNQYKKLLSPFKKDSVEIVYGSRELSKKNKYSHLSYYAGGKLITLITNILYGSSLTDEPTGYKVFKRKTLKSIPLESNGFEFCSEVTAHVLSRGIKIHEVPITYKPRSLAEGKKIKLLDGLEAIWTLVRIKFNL